MLTYTENLVIKEEYRLLLTTTNLEDNNKDTVTNIKDQEDYFNKEDRVINLISNGEDYNDFLETKDDQPNDESNE